MFFYIMFNLYENPKGKNVFSYNMYIKSASIFRVIFVFKIMIFYTNIYFSNKNKMYGKNKVLKKYLFSV